MMKRFSLDWKVLVSAALGFVGAAVLAIGLYLGYVVVGDLIFLHNVRALQQQRPAPVAKPMPQGDVK